MNVIFACAGTGGHVNPAIAMAKIILKNKPDTKVLFIGTKDGLENSLVKNAGFDIEHISTGKIIRSFTLKNFKAITNTYKGIGDAKKIIKEFKADLVIGTGGYICGPVMLASRKLKVPYVLHESNAFPGVSVRLLARKAKKVMIGFEDARKRLKDRENIVYTGTPARFDTTSFDKLNKEECKKEFGLDKISKKIVLVTCGSQGAVRVNETIIEMLKNNLVNDYFIVLVTGNKNYDNIKSKIEKIGKENNIDFSNKIRIEKFVYEITTTDFSEILKTSTTETENEQSNIIDSTELSTRFIENTLVISEVQQRVILPYNINTVKDILLNDPQGYSSLQGVVNKLYTKSIDYYKFPALSRFKEAYKLVIEREKGSKAKALGLAFELFLNYNLHPAIITACKSLDELDVYLACLEDNTLEDFHFFDIKYEIPPAVPKHTKNVII